MAASGIDWAQVGAEYRSGATFAPLGTKGGRDPTGIRLALIRTGVQMENGRDRTAGGSAAARARRTAEAAKRHALVEQMHAEGRSVAEIAETLSYAPKTVRLLIGGNTWRDDYTERNARVVEAYQGRSHRQSDCQNHRSATDPGRPDHQTSWRLPPSRTGSQIDDFRIRPLRIASTCNGKASRIGALELSTGKPPSQILHT